jgi:hypothetical protein
VVIYTDMSVLRGRFALSRGLDALAAFGSELERDRELAATWLELLRASPARATLVAETRRILDAWPEVPELVGPGCAVLLRAAERAAPDEPPAAGGPAQLAAEAAARCLARLQDQGDAPARAELWMARANALRLCHAHDEALACAQRALAAEPMRGGFWFDLGLLHKARRDFRAGLEANRRARALLGEHKAPLWNLAICATALGEGAVAVEAWRALGHAARTSPSGMPYVEGMPPLAVRAATLGAGIGGASSVPERSVGFERFWVTPLSPCHGVVSSASYRDASIDYGDVVLWDGVPVAIFEHEGKPTPCFALLSVLRRGPERRFRFVALQQRAGQVAALGADLPPGGLSFLHHERIEMLCARCASGEHLLEHRHEPAREHRLVYGKMIVPGDVDLHAYRRELELRLRNHSGVQLVMPGLLEAVGDSPAAGKAHQLWRALERSAAKLGR